MGSRMIKGWLNVILMLRRRGARGPCTRSGGRGRSSMRKFAGYPIMINYNLHTQLRSRSEEARLHEARRYEEERKLSIKTNTTSDSNIENNLWKQEIDRYEATIYEFLQKIDRNPVGRMVLGLLNKQTTVWIIPKSDKDLKQCSCSQTGPLKYDIQKEGSVARGVGSGETVITYRPELGDDVLFHELVHAYRYSRKKCHHVTINVHTGRNAETVFGTQSIEQFL